MPGRCLSAGADVGASNRPHRLFPKPSHPMPSPARRRSRPPSLVAARGAARGAQVPEAPQWSALTPWHEVQCEPGALPRFIHRNHPTSRFFQVTALDLKNLQKERNHRQEVKDQVFAWLGPSTGRANIQNNRNFEQDVVDSLRSVNSCPTFHFWASHGSTVPQVRYLPGRTPLAPVCRCRTPHLYRTRRVASVDLIVFHRFGHIHFHR